jgi:hypothetical protein
MTRVYVNNSLDHELIRILCTTTLTEQEARRELNFPSVGISPLNYPVERQRDTCPADQDGPIDWDGAAY